MASTFFGLNIAVSGMNTYNAVLNTTATYPILRQKDIQSRW